MSMPLTITFILQGISHECDVCAIVIRDIFFVIRIASHTYHVSLNI